MPGARTPAWTPDGWERQYGREVPTRPRENRPREKRIAPEDPRIRSITFHPRVSGRPFRPIAIDGLSQHAIGHEGVWIPRVCDLMERCWP